VICLVLLLAASVLGPGQDGTLEDLAAAARWEELIVATAERLGEAPEDPEALYWSGRAYLERAQSLLDATAGRGRSRGADLARDLARAFLDRARDQLARVPATGDGFATDAADWLAYARYLGGEDPQLAEDMERWYAEDQAAYAAYVRGLIARDVGDAAAAEWFERAARAGNARPDFALVWAEALAVEGDGEQALEAWEAARRAGASTHALAATLQGLLPDVEDAGKRLDRLELLVVDDAARQDALLAWYRAHALEQLGRVSEAEETMAAATRQRTDATERAHARLLALLDRPRDAMTLLQRAVADGDDASLEQLVALADDLGRRRQFDDALAAYDAALDAEPNHGRAEANRALTQARAGRSLDGYAALLARRPGRADLLNDAGLASWGWARLDEARQRIEAAAALPGSRDAQENLAALLLTIEPVDPARAEELLASVLEVEPTRARALFLRHYASAIKSR
jgi:hypothetical protein